MAIGIRAQQTTQAGGIYHNACIIRVASGSCSGQMPFSACNLQNEVLDLAMDAADEDAGGIEVCPSLLCALHMRCIRDELCRHLVGADT